MGLSEFGFPSSLFGRSQDDKAVTDQCASSSSPQRILSDTGSIVDASRDIISVLPKTTSPISLSRSPTSVPPRPLRASLPSSWYTNENFFALETRAIFSQV